MRVEIINVGTKLLSGHKSQSGPFLASALSSIGLPAQRLITAGDDPDELKDVLSGAAGRSGVVFTVGGIGATRDDITRAAVASFVNRKLRFSRRAMEHVAGYFARQGREVPKLCESQADIIEGSDILSNSIGSSPGLMFQDSGVTFILLPGTCLEVEAILKAGLLSRLKGMYESRIIKTARLRVLGLCEMKVSEALNEIIQTENQLDEGAIDFSFENTPEGCDFAISCTGKNELLVDELIHKTKAEVYGILGNIIYAEDADTLESAVGRSIVKRRLSLSVAESCTGGMLSSRITDAPGSSVYFRQGAVVYSSRAKVKYLGVSNNTISEYGAVSEETALEMALNIKQITASDCAISVTGYAGPDAADGTEPGSGFIGIVAGESHEVHRVLFSGSRKLVKQKFAASALGFLWKKLREI